MRSNVFILFLDCFTGRVPENTFCAHILYTNNKFDQAFYFIFFIKKPFSPYLREKKLKKVEKYTTPFQCPLFFLLEPG